MLADAMQEHSAALAHVISRNSVIMLEFGAGAVGDPGVRVNALITDLINRLQVEAPSETKLKSHHDEETLKAKRKEDLEADIAKHSSKLETAFSRSTLDGEISSRDQISQHTVEQTADTPVPQVVEELAEASKVFSQDRVQQRSGGQIIRILVFHSQRRSSGCLSLRSLSIQSKRA